MLKLPEGRHGPEPCPVMAVRLPAPHARPKFTAGRLPDRAADRPACAAPPSCHCLRPRAAHRLLNPSRRRHCLDPVRGWLGVSERRAGRVLGQHRSTQHRLPRGRDEEGRLVAARVALARPYGRYGDRRLAARLREAGRSTPSEASAWRSGDGASFPHRRQRCAARPVPPARCPWPHPPRQRTGVRRQGGQTVARRGWSPA